MLIQNISGAASAAGFASDGGPTPVAAPQTQVSPPQVAAKTAQPTDAQLKSAVDSINHAMKQNNSNVEFTIDKDTQRTVIKVVDSGTGAILRQFPTEEILAVSRMIAEAQRGALVKQKA
jgi:flagellar protein FlaG